MSESENQAQTGQTAEAVDHNQEIEENGQTEAAADAQSQADADNAASEAEALRKQAEENHERYLRVQADFDNFRRRTRQEKEDFAKYAASKLLEQLVPVVDNFERALASSKETKDLDSLLKGLDMIFRQFDQVLEQEGLKRMEAVGQPFNPEFHQAIQQVESEDHEEGIVVEEVQKGYLYKDKVLRPAMVKVSL